MSAGSESYAETFSQLRRTADELTQPFDDAETFGRLLDIAGEAGRLALDFFRPGGKTTADIEWKGDGTPVTDADFAVNAFLEQALKALWPGAAWLSEESADDRSRLETPYVIIVDPIDGTRGFARGDPHWAVAIALVHAGRPICAVVHAPALGETYAARAGHGATLNGKPIRLDPGGSFRQTMRVTCPSVLSRALEAAGIAFAFQPKIASLALRIARVASGVYDAGLTTSNSHDWDIAAADLILQEAGGCLTDLYGAAVIYNRPDPTHGILTATTRSLQPSFRDAVARTSFGRNRA